MASALHTRPASLTHPHDRMAFLLRLGQGGAHDLAQVTAGTWQARNEALTKAAPPRGWSRCAIV